MIIIQLAGGLGNQLQQYALYKKFVRLGTEARLDLSWFEDKGPHKESRNNIVTDRELELAYFDNLAYEICTDAEREKLIGKKGILVKLQRKFLPSSIHCFQESEMNHPEIFEFEDRYLSGYFACEKYYADILDGLRRELRFPVCAEAEIRHRNEEMIEKMASAESVSVHIRRGDYLDAANEAMFGGICTEAYYEAAMAWIRERYPKARFFFFSDDIPYVREYYAGEDCEIIDWNTGPNSFYDMMLMSRCRHNICANSTFSFWGARLNAWEGKSMIRPSIHKNTQVCIPEQMKQLWSGWTLITPQGAVV